MVEVVTRKEFVEFQFHLKKRFDGLEEKLSSIEEEARKHKAGMDEALSGLVRRIDEVEEKSKSIVTRIREAFPREGS